MNKNLILDVEQNPSKLSHWILFALQHVLAVLVATITVPLLVPGMPLAATMVSAGIGTLFYLFVTKSKSPVFLSSSFAYIAPMTSATAVALISDAAVPGSGNINYMALILGMAMVGLVYVIVALFIKKFGTNWLNKVLPPVVAGPVIMVIGLSLAGNAVGDIVKGNIVNAEGVQLAAPFACLICGLVTLFTTMLCSTYGRRFCSGRKSA